MRHNWNKLQNSCQALLCFGLLTGVSGCGLLSSQLREQSLTPEIARPDASSQLENAGNQYGPDKAAIADSVRPVVYTEPLSSESVPAQSVAEPIAASVSLAASAVAAEQVELPCQTCEPGYEPGFPLPAYDCNPAIPNSPRLRDAQEYIFDGGDQQGKVVIRKDWSSAGVDPTDTIAYYETEPGLVCVQPTNRVPIYAPRFGAVRQVTGAFLTERAVGTERILAPVTPGRFEDRDLAGAVTHPLAALGEEQVARLDAFREHAAGSLIDGVVPPGRMSEAFVPHEGIEVIGTGKITDEEIAVLGEFIQNAQAWTNPESVGVLIEGKAAARVSTNVKLEEVHVYEIRDNCALRICKAASHTMADPGETIRFTIRFDNAGTKPLQNVVILDNLSPRLEYVEGSQQSSVAADFSLEPNGVGSDVVTWRLEKSIAPGDGGVISFDCLVR